MKLKKQFARTLAVATAALATWLLAACSADPEFRIDDDGIVPDEVAGEIPVGFSVDNMMYGGLGGYTRADDETGETDAEGHPATSAEGHEKQIDHVYFIFFDKNGRFVTYQRSSVTPGATRVTFPVPSSLQTLTDYSVVMVANADNYVPVGYSTFPSYLGSILPGKTMTQVKNELALGTDHTMTKEADQYLPMEGKLVDEEGNEIKFNYDVVNGKYVANGAILFKRQVVRVDLNNYAVEDLDIKWVKICNYRNTTYVCRDYYTGGTVQPGINDAPPVDQRPYYIEVEPAADNTEGVPSQQVRASLYAFPNQVASPSQDDGVTTYIMIAAVYKGKKKPAAVSRHTRAAGEGGTTDPGTGEGSGEEPGGDTPETPGEEKLCYYRFNLNRGKDAQFLEKNHIYTANIMGVKGEGAESESAARLTDAPVLIATVEETWDDDDTNSDADASGNFLILSRTSLTFQGDAGQTQNISVNMSPGMNPSTLRCQEVSNTGNSNADFSVTKEENANKFVFRTLTRNNTNFVKYGYFKISAVTADNKKELSVIVNVMQLSVNDDVKMLTVNGQTGTLEPKVSGTGTTFLFQVQTGSMTQGWTCAPESEGNWTPWAAAGASYTRAGGNKGFLEISIPANISGADREINLIVRRNGVTEEEVKPVIIHLKQAKSKVLLSVFPYPQNGELVLEGFYDQKRVTNQSNNEDRTNSFSVQKDVFVTLADPVKYQYKVESNFDGYRDLRLSANSALLRTIKVEHPDLNTANNTPTNRDANLISPQTYVSNQNYQCLDKMGNGEKFYMNVFRTGPGDPDIVGTIRITAYPKDGQTGETQTISFDVRIVTSCEIGDAVIYSSGIYGNGQAYLVADRNVGAVPRLNGTNYERAVNYSNISNLKITGTNKQTDAQNKLFSGSYYSWQEMNTTTFPEWVRAEFISPNIDVNQITSPFYTNSNNWYVPNISELQYVFLYMQWSKFRPYIVSDIKHNGKYIGCYFPIAGTDANTSTTQEGYYLTRDPYRSYVYLKRLNYSGFVSSYNAGAYDGYDNNMSQGGKYNVRCIRTLSGGEVSNYQTWLNKH